MIIAVHIFMYFHSLGKEMQGRKLFLLSVYWWIKRILLGFPMRVEAELTEAWHLVLWCMC